MPVMSDGDSVSSILDDMLFGSGSFETNNTEYGDLTKCIHEQDEISRSDLYCSAVVQENLYADIHKEPQQVHVFSTHNSSGPYYVKMHDNNEVPIIPMSRVKSDSEICLRSCHNNCSSSLQHLIRKHEALDTMHVKRRKCDLAYKVTKAQEREFNGDNLTDATLKCNLRTEEYADTDKSVKHDLSKEYKDTNKLTFDSPKEPCQTWEEIANCKAGQTRETIKCSQGELLKIGLRLPATHERSNDGEPLSGQYYYTCHFDLQNEDQFMTNNGYENNGYETGLDDFSSAVEEPHKENVGPEVMKASKYAANITPELKNITAHVDSDCDNNLLKSHEDESNEVINSAQSTNVLLGSLNTASFDNDLEQDIGNLADVSDVSADGNACDKAKTKEDTMPEDVSRVNEELQMLDLSRDDQNPQQMRNIFFSDKSNERLEVASLEVMASDLHSDQSESSSYDSTETRVKELSEDFKLSMVNEDYVQQLNRAENQFNKTSSDPQYQHTSTDPQHQHALTDPQHQHASTDSQHQHASIDPQHQHASTDSQHQHASTSPNSLIDLRDLHPDIPGVSLIHGQLYDIRNIRIEDSHSQRHPRNESEYVHENGFNVYGSASRGTLQGHPVQLQEINDNYPQHENGSALENYILSSPAQSRIYFQQGANRLLVGDTERSMAEVPRNGRREESIIYELANEFRDVKVEAFNTHHRETLFQVNHTELSHSDHDLFGGPDESSFPHSQEGMSSTAHQDDFQNSPACFLKEKTREIIPSVEVTLPVHTADSFLSHQSINETPEILETGSSYRANDISGEINIPVQEAISRSRSCESLHRDQERPFFCRHLSCPSTESRTDSISFDEEQQRDHEYALELQHQINHDILMEDEALARRLDNSQRQTLNPPGYGSRRTEFIGPRAEDMINLNPRRRQQRQQHGNRHPGRHRRETAASRDGQSNRELGLEDMISLHENNSGHSVHSHETSQGNLQGVMQQRGAVAGANVADSRVPFDSDFQSVRQSSGRATIRNRSVPHRFEPDPVERVERIPGQSAQIDPSVITPLSRNYQEERRQLEEQRTQLEARHWQHQHHYRQQNWRTGLDLLPNEDYPSLDVHSSYYDPDEVFEIEDGEQYVSISQDPFILRRFLRSRRPTFEMPDQDSYNELWNLVEMLGEVRQQGLNQTHIEMLPVHTFDEGNSGESKECNICLSAYSNGDEIRTLTCLHMFHTACIDEWLNRNAACPVCRRRIEIEDS